MKAEVLLSAAQLEVEQPAVERQRLIDIADLEGDVIETDGAGFLCLRHSCLRLPAPPLYGDVTVPRWTG